MKAHFNSEIVEELSLNNKGYVKQDELKVSSLSLKPRQECSKVCVFGTCLEHLMQMTPSMTVPLVVSRLCRFIERYGLYQQCLFQEMKEKGVIECLKMKFNELGDAPLESSSDVLAASVLLKLFFEELPEPLIPKSLQADFFDNMKKCVVSSSDCVKNLRYLVDKLPCSVFIVLKYLSHFLLQIANHGDSNGLSCVNLGTIFGPIIFRPLEEDPLICIMIKNITYCFVADYYSIFEEKCDILFDTKMPKMMILSPYRKNRSKGKVSSLPTKTMEKPLQPLRVIIPSVDVLASECDELHSNTSETPVLLIEKSESVITEDLFQKLPIFSDGISKHSPSTRKRKENTITGESISFYGMKHWPLLFDALERKEEASEDRHRISNEPVLNLHHNNEYLESSFGLESNEQLDCSSHPPDAKRRELDSVGCPLFTSKCELNANVKQSYILQPWLSIKSLTLPYKEITCRHSIATSDLNLKKDQTQSYLSEDSTEQKALHFLDDSKLSTHSTSLHRSSSCPIPIADGESSLESDSTSLSWNALFDSEEPVQPAHHLSWPMLKASDDEEPVTSGSLNNQNEAPLSPSAYRSYLSHRSSHLDPSIPPSPPFEQEHFEKSSSEDSASTTIRQLTKKIHALKKKIWHFEEKYELEYGYKPSHAEKTRFPEAKKLMSDLHKARKSLKALKEETHMMTDSGVIGSNWLSAHDVHILEDTTNCLKGIVKDPNAKLKPSIQTSFDETLKSLDNERKLLNRPESFEDMTSDQVKDEKLAIQKVLLQFESIHGKPSKPSDRNTVRPLYDRYRNVKRLLFKSNSFPVSSSKCNPGVSLQPIMEHEAMDFSTNQGNKLNDILDEHALDNDCDGAEDFLDMRKDGSRSLEKKYNNSYLHELPLQEMLLQQQHARVEKRRLHKILREFEAEFLRINGRKVQREDKAPVEALYAEYKLVKARLRLLEALVSKHHEYIHS